MEDKKIKEYIRSLVKYMYRNGFTKKPLPKIILNKTRQHEPVFIKTGYYDPENKEVTVFTEGRHIKDILRSIAHELIHHRQNMEGRLGKGAYDGDEVIHDNKLQKLEEEAYKDGNIGFRSWTETIKE